MLNMIIKVHLKTIRIVRNVAEFCPLIEGHMVFTPGEELEFKWGHSC